MAQVTMTSQEYLEMVEAVRRLEQLEKEMIDPVEVEEDLERQHNTRRNEIYANETAQLAEVTN